VWLLTFVVVIAMSSSASGSGLGADGMKSMSGGQDKTVDVGADSVLDAALAAVGRVVPATLLPEAMFQEKKEGVYRLYKATSKADKAKVDAEMVVYFAVHGTSPHTQWSTYEFDMVALGIAVPVSRVVEVIGTSLLKKFMGRFSPVAMALYTRSPEFRSALASRAASAGLEGSDGVYAIDYVGKDGKLDAASMVVRNRAKARLVGNRNTSRSQETRDQVGGVVLAREVAARGSEGVAVDPFA